MAVLRSISSILKNALRFQTKRHKFCYFGNWESGAKQLSKSVLVCSSRRCASFSTLSFTSFRSTKVRNFELGASTAAASNEGFEEVVEGQPLPALGSSYTWPEKKRVGRRRSSSSLTILNPTLPFHTRPCLHRPPYLILNKGPNVFPILNS
ncbi:hypothetical protein GBA52_006825 [Prunus armeniaca]|nr:hypothetical protein GBA52_006825 [Prunus armeniaca]